MNKRHRPLSRILAASLISLTASYSAQAENEKPQLDATSQQTESVSSKASANKNYVRLAKIELSAAAAALPFSGTVRAADTAPLAFQASGRLERRPAQLGQTVAAGELLAVLDNPQLKPALAAAEARVRELSSRLGQSQRDLQRVNRLIQSGSATREEVEQVKANNDALKASAALARAERDRAKQLLAETRLAAPFAGQISAVFIEPGQIVAPGQPVLSLSGANGLEMEIGLPARMLPWLQTGLAVPLAQFNQPLQLDGRVSRIAQTSQAGQLNRVLISLPDDPRLHAGMTLTAKLPASAAEQLYSVPVRAVVDTGRGVPRLFRYRDGVVESLIVELHRVLGATVLITGPLQAGERVVVAGLAGLQDGQAVVPLN